jgi:hypothetical protein
MKIASYEAVCFPIGLKMHKRPRDGGKELLVGCSSGRSGIEMPVFHSPLALHTFGAPSHPPCSSIHLAAINNLRQSCEKWSPNHIRLCGQGTCIRVAL